MSKKHPPHAKEAPQTQNEKPQETTDGTKKQDELLKALEEAKAKADKHWEQLLRKEAELQNTQRRAQMDLEKAHKFALERFAKELLQVVDSIEQGLSISARQNAQVQDVLAGMALTQKVVLDVMEKEGITQIDPMGQPFDHNFHEALTVQETKDVPPGHILHVIQKGYLLKDRLLRPARVIVSKAQDEEQQDEEKINEPRVDEQA